MEIGLLLFFLIFFFVFFCVLLYDFIINITLKVYYYWGEL